MAERFKIGEVAILVLAPGDAPSERWSPYTGQEVEIVGGLRKREWRTGGNNAAYVVRAQDGHKFGAPPRNLRKKRLPPPRQELGEWDLCPWRPERNTETVRGEHG